jgi:hypothetical protein
LPCSPRIRKLFQDVSEATVRRIIAGRTVRVVPVEGVLYLFVIGFKDLILVEPRVRRGGALELAYALRDDGALAEHLDRPRTPRKAPSSHEYRSGTQRRLGRSGTVA